MGWTKAQQKVIDTRNKNLLVSAAAGSGKTAVLVERIISMISEGEQPMDIDHLLVVTFTNAAAAEMRGRIGNAIDAKLLKEPDNLHLQKQISLLQSAQITTIHSFCLNVIRNYFHRIDLDPAFKIAEESEITLMKSDVISDILERWYEEGREDFHAFIESYSYSKSDTPIEELILSLYHFSMSAPWPKEWLKQKEDIFQIESLDEMYESKWMQELLRYLDVVLGDLMEKNNSACDICEESGGPAAYLPALFSDRSMIETMRSAKTYSEYAAYFMNISFDRLSNKRDPLVLDWKKDKVKELREEVKKGIKDLSAQFFFQSPEEMLSDIEEVKDVMKVLFELTIEFMDEFSKKKEEKNLIDFNDLEHLALKILVEENNGEIIPTQAAIEISEQIDEILIDEYQDSNLVQETILQSISREHQGLHNRFMVGDVKQSIYKFRLAMPELFMEKYNKYSTEDTTEQGEINDTQRIDLDKNFRSRKIVLDSVNRIFEQIMMKSVGGITYDEAASLKYGELFEETLDTSDTVNEIKDRISNSVELLLVTEESGSDAFTSDSPEDDLVEDDTMDADPEEGVYTKKEIEARAIAAKIKELTNPETGLLLYDAKTKTHRLASYRDMVILLRSMSGWSEVIVNTLMQEGISAYADTGTGYFQTVEIMTVLNMLRVIDNPLQDIPLTGVLYSPMVGLTTTELAMVRAIERNAGMYTAVCHYATEGTDQELKQKINQFLIQLENYRSMMNHTPIHELIQEVLEQSRYYYYVSAMPGGERRKANIDMLISYAIRFEKGSYSGLFHFIRYMEKLHKYEVDFGEASVTDEQDNTVRIMSIHKSKGLEFPVVFVAGMSKQFNNQDMRSSIVLHNDLGVGPEYINSKLRTKVPTLIKKVIQKKVQVENLGEELRVLYVALTRAKEKLIMTGYLKSVDEIRRKGFSFFEMISSKSYLDLVLPAIMNRMNETENISKDESLDASLDASRAGNGFAITILSKDQLLSQEIRRQVFLRKDEDELMTISPDTIYDKELREEIKSRFDYQYPYQEEANLRVKMTVSELKKLGQFVDEHEPQQTLQITKPEDYEIVATVPDFIRQDEKEISNTDRGTLYHKVLELLDLTKVYYKEDVLIYLDTLVKTNRIKEEDRQRLQVNQLLLFVQSSVADRMRNAQITGKLYKEKQFVFGMKALEVMEDTDSEELVLIQGIIDVFFEEDGALVLLDYKSDYVSDEQILIDRYKVQLHYYRKALEQMTNQTVKEMLIYSLSLGKEIRID